MSRVLIIGGTGSLGRAILGRTDFDRDDVMVMSREELKQKKTKERWPDVRMCLGDVKVRGDVDRAIAHFKPHIVYHLAAQKHVDIAEENPAECIAVNITGTQNVADACMRHGVKICKFTSTDKAVLPINLYGFCKAASEKYLFEMNGDGPTNFFVYRYGNVIGSRGSVIHSFKRSLETERKVYITDMAMSRFWIHLDDVVKFIAEPRDITAYRDKAIIPAMKASTIIALAEAVARHLEISDFEVVTTGIRRGEKFAECLWSEHDTCIRSDTADHFSADELAQLVERVLE